VYQFEERLIIKKKLRCVYEKDIVNNRYHGRCAMKRLNQTFLVVSLLVIPYLLFSNPVIVLNPPQLLVNLNVDNPIRNTTFTIANTGLDQLDYTISNSDTLNNFSYPTNGIVAYYPFNGNADDESGNGLNGNNIGAIPVPDRNGNLDSAFYFNGSTSNVDIPNIAFNNLQEATIAIWVKFNNVSNQPLIVKHHSGVNNFGYLCVGGSAGSNGLPYSAVPGKVYYRLNNQTPSFESNQILQPMLYYFIVLTLSPTSISLYINGAFDKTVQGNYAVVNDLIALNEIGAFENNLEQSRKVFLNGTIDDFFIYNRTLSQAEIESMYSSSFPLMSFNPTAGMVSTNSNTIINTSFNGSDLSDGIHNETIIVNSNDPNSPHTIPITINVDFTPPTQVQNLVNIDALTDANQITIAWDNNALADSVRHYKIYRKSIYDTGWITLATLSPTVNQYIDRQFTGLDTTFVYYKVTAIDNADNEGIASDSIMTCLKRYRAPQDVTIENLNNYHIKLQWSPVTQTLAGTTGTPTCYIIYKNNSPVPITDFDYLGYTITTEYIHTGALFFQPANKLFYVVTAYGGDMPWLRQNLTQRKNWKYAELENALQNGRGK
jgi:hypothetical protein